MIKFALIGATAIAAAALASPASAQEVIYNPGWCAQFYPNANCQNKGPGNPYTGSYQRSQAYRQSQGSWNGGWDNRGWDNRGWHTGWNEPGYVEPRYRTGFWPGDVAAGAVGTAGAVAGAAVGTAGAIATAPFRAADNWDRRSYAERNGFVCTPGTFFKGADGRRHICQ